jgi:hypothetical protein
MGLSVLVLAAALMATVTLNRCRSVLWFQGNGAVYVMNLLLGGRVCTWALRACVWSLKLRDAIVPR